jgi:3'(2'), 5'-bisphosphate nucleotidase
MNDGAVAREVASEAGDLLLEIRGGLDEGRDPEEIRKEGDRRSNDLILSLLRERFPADAILSEEAPRPSLTESPARLWIVDPLDGTREFGEAGRSDWAVHVALSEHGRLVAGAVTLPARRGACFATDRAPSRVRCGERALRIAVSRTRPPAEAVALAERLGGELVPMGSAGAKAMAVLTGEVDVYVHSGGQYAWDSAAPVAVATAAGLHASRIDGSPLAYAGEVWMPDLLVCRPELRSKILRALCEI